MADLKDRSCRNECLDGPVVEPCLTILNKVFQIMSEWFGNVNKRYMATPVRVIKSVVIGGGVG